MILFMPYVGGQSNKVQNYADLPIYDCPSYPDKEQTVDWPAPGKLCQLRVGRDLV
jgi:hypothetical protein